MLRSPEHRLFLEIMVTMAKAAAVVIHMGRLPRNGYQ